MFDYLLDNNVLTQIFKGNQIVTNFVGSLNFAVCATVYIEALQGSISNAQKRQIKKVLDNVPLLLITPEISRRAITLIDDYSNSYGLLLADALIAASALENDLILITYNTDDFKFIQNLNHQKPLV